RSERTATVARSCPRGGTVPSRKPYGEGEGFLMVLSRFRMLKGSRDGGADRLFERRSRERGASHGHPARRDAELLRPDQERRPRTSSDPDLRPVPPGASVLESTATLLARLRKGDLAARDRILARYRPTLQRWAHGRLPSRARGLVDTDDLVQITLIRALNRL